MNVRTHTGYELPALGFGTFQIPPGEATYKAVSMALESGYTHIDTAKYYENERDVASAIQSCGLEGKIQVTTKVWKDELGYQQALDAGRRSRDYLGCQSIDMLLVHWPTGQQFFKAWEAFERLKEEGTVAHLGVSNFNPHHLEALKTRHFSKPEVNQVELHPLLSQKNLRNYSAQENIIVESWSPLIRGDFSAVKDLETIATAHNKTIAQVILRWIVQSGMRVLVRSVHAERIRENIDIFDFELNENELIQIEAHNKDQRIGPDPDEFI